MKDMHIVLVGNRGGDVLLWNFQSMRIQGVPMRISIDIETSQARLVGEEGGSKVMKIVVISGSGLIGKKLVHKLTKPGHQVVPTARDDEQEVCL